MTWGSVTGPEVPHFSCVNRLENAGLRNGLVVDLGCGSGILAQELCAAGYKVHGIDQSEDMLLLARQRARTARFEGAVLAERGYCALPGRHRSRGMLQLLVRSRPFASGTARPVQPHP